MRIHISIKAAFLTLICASGYVSAATYTKTVSMPSGPSVMSSGTPNMAANILEVGMKGVEYIPSAASESKALANISKGLRIPSSGVLNVLKGGMKANLPGLLIGGAVSALVAGVDWIETDGVLMKKAPPTGTAMTYVPSGSQYSWKGPNGSGFSSARAACPSSSPRGWGGSLSSVGISPDGMDGTCYYSGTIVNPSGTVGDGSVSRTGNQCPANAVFNVAAGGCVSTQTTPTPVLESDFDVLDGFVKNKDGVYVRDLADEVCKASGDYDGCLTRMGAAPYVSGPANVTSPETTTTTKTSNPDGTSTEVSTKTKTDYGLTYPSSAPGTVAIDPKTTTTTTTTTKDANGTITGTNTTTGETTTTQPGSGTEISEGTFTDSPFPEVSPFYTQKFPGGFKDVWNTNKQAFDSSPFVEFLHSFVPSFSGSCPSWAMSFDIMPYAHFGSQSFGSLCNIFAIIKVIMLVTAMFTCRALIFGG